MPPDAPVTIAVFLPGITNLPLRVFSPIRSRTAGPLAAASLLCPRRDSLPSRTNESLHQCGHLIGGGVHCEMTAVDNVNFGIRHILAVAFRLAGIERSLVPAPDHQQSRLLLAHP